MSITTRNIIDLASMKDMASWLGVTDRTLYLWRKAAGFTTNQIAATDGSPSCIGLNRAELLKWIRENKKPAWRRLIEKGIVTEEVSTRTFYIDEEQKQREL